jgi:hypothetical protein
VHPCTGTEAVRPIGGVEVLTTALEGVKGQRHAPAVFYPRERPGTHYTGGWVGPRAGLDRCGKSRPHQDWIPGPSSPQPVAIPSELSRPTPTRWYCNEHLISITNYSNVKIKFVKIFLYAAVTVASPSCALFSWICSSVHCMVCISWQSDVQSLIHWIKHMTLIPRHYITQKLPQNHSHSNYHMPKQLRWSRGSVLAFGTQVCRFTPSQSCRIFRAKKSSALLPLEGK